MIILDTNIISEFMSPSPASEVVNWLNTQETTSLYLSSITIAEIHYGLNILPEGRRKRILNDRFQQFLHIAFDNRILSFDEPSARIYGEIMSKRKLIGRPLSNMDGQIAAIAKLKGFSIATRNIKDFEHCNIDLINPFVFV